MLSENFVVSTKSANTVGEHTAKFDGLQVYEYQPQVTPRKSYKNSSCEINSVGLSKTHIFAAQAGKSTVHVYNRFTGRQDATVAFQRKITSIAVTWTDFPVVVLGTDDGSLVLWETCTGRQVVTPAAHLQPVTCVFLTPDNLQILSGAADSTINVWSLERTLSFSRIIDSDTSQLARPSFSYSEHRSAIIAITSSNSHFSSNTVISASTDGAVHRWNPTNGQKVSTSLSAKTVTSLCLDPADRALYLGHDDGSISVQDLMVAPPLVANANGLFDINSAKDTCSPSITFNDGILCMTLTYDGTTLLTGHASGRVSSWNLAKRSFLKEVMVLENPVTNLVMLSPEGLPDHRVAVGNAIIKPRLDLSSSSHTAETSGIPLNYVVQTQILGLDTAATIRSGMTEDGWPEELLREEQQLIQHLDS